MRDNLTYINTYINELIVYLRKTKIMKLYYLSQNENNGYDTFDSCIVCAESKEDAKLINPYGSIFIENNRNYGEWAKTLKGIECVEIGIANKDQERGVILASFNAG